MVGNMLNKWKALATGLLVFVLAGPTFAQQIALSIGNVTVPPADVNAASCIQVPIFINDPMDGRDLRDLTFTVEISGDTGIIDGGVATNMIVANSFDGTAQTGISNPGTDLDNVNPPGNPSPTCSMIFNRATQGQGAAVDFLQGTGSGAWTLNNNQGGVGRKQGFVIDPFLNSSIAATATGDLLIAVLEIPIIANPGTAQLLITATPNAMVADANVYTWDDGVRTNENGERVQISEDLILPGAPSQVNIFDPVDCVGATAAPNPATYLDAQAGGIGGDLTFTFPGTTNVDQIRLTGDGLPAMGLVIPSGGATTMTSISTQGDGSPEVANATNNYSVVYEVEFPPASGTFVAGAPCAIGVPWEAPSCTVDFTVQPINGGNSDINVTLTNAVWDGARFGTLDIDVVGGMSSVDLVVPDSVAGNTLTFNNVFALVGIDNNDVGDYTVNFDGPGGQAGTCNAVLTLLPPVNETVCANITQAAIEGSVDINLQGNDGVIDFDVVYNGTTFSNLPEGVYTLNNITGNATDVIIRANGFDMGGNPISDDLTCDLDYVLATCMTSQDPPNPVDVGTVVTLTLTTTGATAAELEGVAMTAVMGTPGIDNNITWEATHTAVADVTLTATATNPDGEETTCDFFVDINCIDPSIVSVASVGQIGITIFGTFGCDYTVRIVEHNTGVENTYTVNIDTLDDAVLQTGTGTLNVVVPADAWIEVGQLGLPVVTDMVPTVPTLGEWGLIAFVLLLTAAGVFMMRRRSLTV